MSNPPLSAEQTIQAIESLKIELKPDLFPGKFGVQRWRASARYVVYLQGEVQKFRYNVESVGEEGALALVSRLVRQMYDDGNLLVSQAKALGLEENSLAIRADMHFGATNAATGQ